MISQPLLSIVLLVEDDQQHPVFLFLLGAPHCQQMPVHLWGGSAPSLVGRGRTPASGSAPLLLCGNPGRCEPSLHTRCQIGSCVEMRVRTWMSLQVSFQIGWHQLWHQHRDLQTEWKLTKARDYSEQPELGWSCSGQSVLSRWPSKNLEKRKRPWLRIKKNEALWMINQITWRCSKGLQEQGSPHFQTFPEGQSRPSSTGSGRSRRCPGTRLAAATILHTECR